MDKFTFDGLTRKDSSLMNELVEACKSIELNNDAEFNVNEAQEEIDENDRHVDKSYSFAEFAPHVNLDCICVDSEGGNKSPFEVLRSKMVQITGDGKIFKKIIKHGMDKLPYKAAVYVHYNSYIENEEIPFDSSYLRNKKPLRFQLGSKGFYQGFEMSINTMRKGEKSQFLIDPFHAFGSLGVPPRIPPDATLLLEIELINFVDCGCIQDIKPGENYSFETVHSHAISYNCLGNDYFSNKNINAAISNYKKGEKLLYSTTTQNEEEEIMKKKLRIKLIVNMMVCYNNLHLFAKTCSCAKDAFISVSDEAKTNAKLFYHLGKAQMGLSEYKKASKSMRNALRISPHSKEIIKALIELEQKQKTYNQQERDMYKKAIGFKGDQYIPIEEEKITQIPEEGLVCEEFKSFMTETIADFKRQNNKVLELPSGLTFSEVETCELIANKHNLMIYDKLVEGVQTFYLSK